MQWRVSGGCGISHQPFVSGAQDLLRGQRKDETLALPIKT